MILDRFAPALGSNAELLRQLHHELFASIFVAWESFRSGSASDHSNPAAAYDQEAVDGPGDTLHAGALHGRQTFAQALEELQAMRTEVLGKPARILEAAINIWRRKLHALYFNAWRGFGKRQLVLRQKAVEAATRKHDRRGANSVQNHFRAWRAYVFERRHKCRVVYEENNRVKLVHRMGRRIKALETENARLKRRYETMLEEYGNVTSRLAEFETTWANFRAAMSDKPVDPPVDDVQEPEPPLADVVEDALKDVEAVEVQAVDKLMEDIQAEVYEENNDAVESGVSPDVVMATAKNPKKMEQLGNFLSDKREIATPVDVPAVPAPLAEEVAPDAAPTINYKTVLEWVSSRVLLYVTDANHMRRCANFTSDFKDGERLAYLLMSLGADRALIDEVHTSKTLLERAQHVCEASRLFDPPRPLEPVDIAKAKGGRIAAFLFHLYRHFGHRSLKAGGPSLAVPTAPQGSPRRQEDNSASSVQDDGAEEDPLPDKQYMEWFKELAAEDSDVEEVQDFHEEQSKRRSVVDTLATRLSLRFEQSRRRSQSLFTPPRQSRDDTGEPTVGVRDLAAAQDHAVKARRRMLQWLSDVLVTREGDDLADLSNADFLERLLGGITHRGSARDVAGSEMIRHRHIEKSFEQVHLRNLRLRRPHGTKVTDTVVTMQQLTTALYVMNARDPVVVV